MTAGPAPPSVETVRDFPIALLGPALRITGALLVAFFGSKLAKRLITRVVDRVLVRTVVAGAPENEAVVVRGAVRSHTITGVLTALASGIIWILAALVVLGEVGINLAPMIAGLGIFGVALGFGAQNLVSDLVSGLFMLAEDQFGVGDIVDIDGTTGVVEHVGLRTTQVRALDGMLWTVRNGEISRIANANKGWGRVILDVGVAYDSDLRRAIEVIRDAAKQVHEDPSFQERFLEAPELWGVEDLGDDSVVIRLVCKTAPATQWAIGRELRLRVKEALDREGIEIPFPQRTLWLRTERDALAAAIPFERVDNANSSAGRDGSDGGDRGATDAESRSTGAGDASRIPEGDRPETSQPPA